MENPVNVDPVKKYQGGRVMGLWGHLKTYTILHLLLLYIYIISGLIVSFLMLLTYITVWPFSRTLYRKIVLNLAYTNWCQFTFLGQWWSGSDFTLHLHDPKDMEFFGHEHSLVIMNHKYDIDWLYTWLLAERFGVLRGTKIYGKQILKYIPLLGWMWTFTESIFLKRDWEKDRKTIAEDLQYITSYPKDYNVTLLLFAEGTRFTEEKHRLSMEVAKKKGIPQLKHHLLPRSKGFVLSMHGIKGKVPAILDVTIGFTDEGAEPTTTNVLQGKATRAELYIRRIHTDTVPTDTDEACGEWLQQLYREKDEIYEDFATHGHFTKGMRLRTRRHVEDLVIWCIWAVIICVPSFYYLYTVIILGPLWAKILFAVFIFGLSAGMRAMIGISEIKKGSAYGQKGKMASQSSSQPQTTTDGASASTILPNTTEAYVNNNPLDDKSTQQYQNGTKKEN